MRATTIVLVAVALLMITSTADARPGDIEARRVVSGALNRRATHADRLRLLAQVEALTRKYPTNDMVAYAQGRVLSTLGRSKAALAAYDRAIALNSKFADAQYNAGVVLTRLKRPRRALRRFIAAGKLNPRLGDAFYNAAQVYYNMGKFRAAMQQWQRVLRLGPDDFGIIKKILQCQNAIGQFRAAATTRARLWRIHKTSKNPSIRRMTSVVVDQFNLAGYHVFVFETFATRGNFAYVYKFKLQKNGRIVATIQLETSAVLREQGWDSIVAIVRPSGRRATGISYRKRPAYGNLRRDMKRLIKKIK